MDTRCDYNFVAPHCCVCGYCFVDVPSLLDTSVLQPTEHVNLEEGGRVTQQALLGPYCARTASADVIRACEQQGT